MANGTLEDRRRFYWTSRFFSADSAENYANTTRDYEAALGGSGGLVYSNWNNFAGKLYSPGPVGHNRAVNNTDAAMGSHDWYDFGRARGGSMLWTEDWYAPACEWSFYGARLQSAGASLQLPWGGYVVPRAGAMNFGDLVQRVATIVGTGGKAIIYYNFGPDYMSPGNCWGGDGNDSLVLVPQIQTAHRLLAKAEELLWVGTRPASSVAILSPRSSAPWDELCSLYDDICLFAPDGQPSKCTESRGGYRDLGALEGRNGNRQNRGAVIGYIAANGEDQCCATPRDIMDCTNDGQYTGTVDYMAEVRGDYHALAQVHNIATEFVDETTLATNQTKMNSLSTILLTEPNLPAAAAESLIGWVKAGGHLVLVCAGGVLDEYNTPAPNLWQELGLIKKGTALTDFASWAPAGRMGVKVAGEGQWAPYNCDFRNASHQKTCISNVVNGSGTSNRGLPVHAYGRVCLSSTDLPGDDDPDVKILAKFNDGSTAVSLRQVGEGSVVRFSWLPGTSHASIMYPGRGAGKTEKDGSPRPTMLTDASQWIAAAVALARHPSRAGATATAMVDVPLVETPVLVSSRGVVVTILDWRPNANTTNVLVLNVSLPFAPARVDSAAAGKLVFVPLAGSTGKSGLVRVASPAHGSDFISFFPV